MRRVLLAVLICFSPTFPALARSGGHGGGGSHGGGGHAAVSRGAGAGHAVSSGYRVGGFNRRPALGYGFGFQRYPRIYSYWPYAYGGLGYYGGYYGGYYDPSWYSSPDAYPNYGYNGYNSDYGYPSDQAPPVIINQDFASAPPPAPMVREYGPAAPAPAAAPAQRKYDEPLYLIAFNGGDIRAVLAYWVDGASLHYVTMDHAQKQVALASIDRRLSERLNGERNVNFQLPR